MAHEQDCEDNTQLATILHNQAGDRHVLVPEERYCLQVVLRRLGNKAKVGRARALSSRQGLEHRQSRFVVCGGRLYHQKL